MGGGREGRGREGKGREGRGKGRGGLACEQGLLLPGLGGGWVGWGSERPCSQARPGEGFAAQNNFFSSYFYKILDSK